jgi:hypothetical protein
VLFSLCSIISKPSASKMKSCSLMTSRTALARSLLGLVPKSRKDFRMRCLTSCSLTTLIKQDDNLPLQQDVAGTQIQHADPVSEQLRPRFCPMRTVVLTRGSHHRNTTFDLAVADLYGPFRCCILPAKPVDGHYVPTLAECLIDRPRPGARSFAVRTIL